MNNVNKKMFMSQRESIYSQLKYCINNIPYYKHNWSVILPDNINDFSYEFFIQNIPILEKEIVRMNSEQFISTQSNIDNLIKETTSGTTGHPMVCYKSKMDKLCLSIELWKERKRLAPNISERSKCGRFYSFRRDGTNIITDDVYIRDNVIHLSLFNLSEEMLKMYINSMNSFEPAWLLGAPSAIVKLANVMINENQKIPSIKFIELAGEYVDDDTISFISKVFNCRVGNQYGAREFWSICYGEKNNRMKINTNNVFLELIHNDVINEDELVVTGLTSKSWCLIRYKLGDVASIYEDNSVFYVHLKGGRTVEYYKLLNGKIISPILFSFITRQINEKLKKNVIKNYQIRIKQDNEIFFYFISDNKNDYTDIIVNMLKVFLGNDIKVNAIEVNNLLIDEKTKKLKIIYK
jgi:phenylacetate-CoA ligase